MTSVDEWRVPGEPRRPSSELAAAAAQVRAAYDALLAVAPQGLCNDDLVQLLEVGVQCRNRAAAVLATAAGEADRRGLGEESGARSTGSWWAHRTRLTRAAAGRTVALGRLLGEELHAPVAAALTNGELHADQAGMIVRAVEAIPSRAADLPPDAEAPTVLKERARDHLLAVAAELDSRALHILGKRILQVVAPAIGDAAEAKALAEEEAQAARKVTLILREDGHGSTHGRFTIPVAAGQALRKQLLALADPTGNEKASAAPDSDPTVGVGDKPLPLPARLGWALVEWIERYPAGHLPTSGGVGGTVVVTMRLDTLTDGLTAASLDTGGRISPGQARRLACEAGIIPVVLGGASEPLDVGRTKRFHTRAQRTAMAVRDHGCTARGCHMPPAACHAHHDQPWSRGGHTTVKDGRLLCHRHHRVIHDPTYLTTHHHDGTVSFHRRT